MRDGETNPRKLSGVPILKGTRVQADAIVENYEGGSDIEEIAENFALQEGYRSGPSAVCCQQAAGRFSVRVRFDHNVPHKLRRSLRGHEVSTADEMGWAELENWSVLRAAEDAGFLVMVTADKNLAYQQNLQSRRLALVLLSTNNWNIVKLDTEAAVAAVDPA